MSEIGLRLKKMDDWATMYRVLKTLNDSLEAYRCRVVEDEYGWMLMIAERSV